MSIIMLEISCITCDSFLTDAPAPAKEINRSLALSALSTQLSALSLSALSLSAKDQVAVLIPFIG